jgi:hypothetical protein
VDCGGGICDKCREGIRCTNATDCLSGVCENNKCSVVCPGAYAGGRADVVGEWSVNGRGMVGARSGTGRGPDRSVGGL